MSFDKILKNHYNKVKIKEKDMKKFFKRILAAIAGILAYLGFVSPALALDKAETLSHVSSSISTQDDIVSTAFTVINWILGATFAFAVIMLIVGGFRYITSAGNEGQAEAAKEQITQAIIGLVIVLLAYVIASTINLVLFEMAA